MTCSSKALVQSPPHHQPKAGTPQTGPPRVPSPRLPVRPSVRLSVPLSICPSPRPSVRPSVRLAVSPPPRTSGSPTVRPSVRPSSCPSLCLPAPHSQYCHKPAQSTIIDLRLETRRWSSVHDSSEIPVAVVSMSSTVEAAG